MYISTYYNEKDLVIKLQGQESKSLSIVPLNKIHFIYLQLSLDSCWKWNFSCALVSSLSQIIHGKKPRHDFKFVSLFKELISITPGRFMTKVIAAILETKQATNLCSQPGQMAWHK